MAFVTTMLNSFGGAWFDADMQTNSSTLTEWKSAVINFYVDLLGNYGPPGSEGNSFNEILALYNEGKCGMWIDATIAASFFETLTALHTLSRQTLVTQLARTGCGHGQWLFQQAQTTPKKQKRSSSGQRPKPTFRLLATTLISVGPKFQQVSACSTYALPEFKAVAGFAAAEMAAIESAAPEATDLKPYVGVQFAAIPEFPEVGSAVAQEIAAALSGAKSVDEALAASQAAAEAIMTEAGY